MSFKSISQTSNNCPAGSQCIPTAKLQIAARLIEKGKLDSIQVLLLTQKADTLTGINYLLQQRIIEKDTQITAFKNLELNCSKLQTNYLQEISNLKDQNTARQSTIDDLNRKLKGQKRKTIFVGVAGAAAVVAVLLLKH